MSFVSDCAVDAFNVACPVGSRVVVRRDDGSLMATTTCSPAWLLNDYTAVVMVDGISGAYLLDRVTKDGES